jgi:hypothetical protein
MNHLPKQKHLKLQNLTNHGPGVLLGQMARDTKYKGAGKYILDWVIDYAKKQSLNIGCRLIIVSSEPDVVNWYETNGFTLINGSTKMFFDLLGSSSE